MEVGVAVDECPNPFGQPLSQFATRFFNLFLAWFTHSDGAVVGAGRFADIVGQAKGKEPEIHQDGVEGLAGDLAATAPSAGRAEGTTDLAIQAHPEWFHLLVPKSLHAPTHQTQIAGTTQGDSICIFCHFCGIRIGNANHADFHPLDALGSFRNKFGHFLGVPR